MSLCVGKIAQLINAVFFAFFSFRRLLVSSRLSFARRLPLRIDRRASERNEKPPKAIGLEREPMVCMRKSS